MKNNRGRNVIFLLLGLTFFLNCKNKPIPQSGGSKKTLSNEYVTIQIPNNNNEIGIITDSISGCGYNYLFEEGNLEIEMPNVREKDMINKIVSYTGIPSNFQIYKADIDNAVATIINDERYILYDETLFNTTEEKTKSRWSSVSILAHEIGHHLAGHTLCNTSSEIELELEADKFSGYVLYKMGANLDESIKAINLLGTNLDSHTHPSKSKRIKAITDGWNEANRQRSEAAIPPPPNDDNNYFYPFHSSMLIHKKRIAYAEQMKSDFYTNYRFLYGIVTDVDKGFESFNVRIVRMEDTNDYFRDLTGEDWKVYIDDISFGNTEMCNLCPSTFKALITSGRRIKFSMVENHLDSGTSLNGIWFLTYAEGLKGDEL